MARTASTRRYPATGCSPSTRRRPRSAARCTWATCSATPTPTPSPATSACAARPSSTRWAGTTTACPPSAASRTSTACAATRASTTTPGSSRRSAAIRRRTTRPSRSRARTSSSSATNSSRWTSRSSRRLLKRLGLSVDWNHSYATIDERSRRASQRAFLRNLARGEAYSQEAPTLWDVDFRTAVAQAEMEDRERPGAYHKIPFARTDGDGAIEIDTTRPELLAACVALVAHPDDERYQPLFGTTVHRSALRPAGRGARPRTRPARQGHRHRHDLHVRRHHRRHVVARAEPADARRSSAATAACMPTHPEGVDADGRTRTHRRARPRSRPRRWSSNSSSTQAS